MELCSAHSRGTPGEKNSNIPSSNINMLPLTVSTYTVCVAVYYLEN